MVTLVPVAFFTALRESKMRVQVRMRRGCGWVAGEVVGEVVGVGAEGVQLAWACRPALHAHTEAAA